MKLAEALQERADLNARIEQLEARLNRSCMVQEGEAPLESPEALMKELDGCIERLEYLMTAINRTNAETLIEGETITALIARKDCLRLKLSAYRGLAANAGDVHRRARGSEIKILPTVDVAALQKTIDGMSMRLRKLDNKLQAANWTVELRIDN
ncbi:MAG: DIP1984 family protein [bacterium]